MDLLEKYADELRTVRTAGEGRFFEVPVRETPITVKDNLKRFVSKQTPVFQPTELDYMSLIPVAIPDNKARGLMFDAYDIPESEYGGPDFFGIQWRYVKQVGGSMVVPGAPKVLDINCWEDCLTFPDLDSINWEESSQGILGLQDDNCLNYVWIMNGMFERLISFMDFENAILALVDEDQKEAVHRLFDRLCIFYDDLLSRYKKHYNADIICFHDDWGSQRAPFFSLDTCREMIVPYIKRVAESTHKYGMYMDLHSCGKIEKLVPAMIESGIDIWYGQPMNDFDLLYENYAEEIIFGIPTKVITTADRDEDAFAAAKDFMEKYSKAIPSYNEIQIPRHPKLIEYIYCISREMYSR
jgi:hypothetical protein